MFKISKPDLSETHSQQQGRLIDKLILYTNFKPVTFKLKCFVFFLFLKTSESQLLGYIY